MKLRSYVLLACMIVVPMLAMFSHHIPRDLVATTRRSLWNPALAWSRSLFGGTPSASPAGGIAHTPAPGATAAAATASLTPTEATTPPVSLPYMVPTMMTSPPVGGPPPVVTAGGDVTGKRRVAEEGLQRLGAVAIDCQPLAGAEGLHLGSCRVAVDPEGQLQRVFQASGPDPASALESLLGDVSAWRQRTAARQAATVPAGPAPASLAVPF